MSYFKHGWTPPHSVQAVIFRFEPKRVLVLLGVLWFCQLGLAPLVWANPILIVNESQANYSLDDYISTLPDPDGELTIQDVLKPAIRNQFKVSRNSNPHLPFWHKGLWIKLTVQNPTEIINWLLEFNYTSVDLVEFYIPDFNGDYTKISHHEASGGNDKFTHLRHPTLPIKLWTGSLKTIYIYIEDEAAIPVKLNLFNEATLLDKLSDQQMVLGVYYGALGVVLIYTLFLAFAFKERFYGYYAMYLVSLWGFFSIIDGLFQSGPLQGYWLNNRLMVVAIVLLTISLLQFSRVFLDIRSHFNLMDRFLRIGVWILLAMGGLAFVVPYSLLSQALAILILGGGAVTLIMSILVLRKGFVPARLHVGAWVLLMAGGVLYTSWVMGLIPAGSWAEHSLRICTLLQMILFSMALLDRFNVLRSENIEAQQALVQSLRREKSLSEQNERSLEGEVKARTLELTESEQRYRKVVEESPEATLVHYLGKILFINPAGIRLLGAESAEEVMLFPLHQWLRLKRRPTEDWTANKQIQLDGTLNELEMIRRDGKPLVLDVVTVPILYQSLQAIRMTLHDVTDKKRIENELDRNQKNLQLSESRLKHALMAAEQGLWDWNLTENKIFVDPNWNLLTGHDSNSFYRVLEEWKQTIDSEDLPAFEQQLSFTLSSESQSMMVVQYRCKKKNGDSVWMMARGKVIERSEEGRPLRMIGTIQDITNQKNQELELMEAKLAAEKAVITKSQFLANMSHEIRTPLNAILGYCQILLRKTNRKPELKPFRQQIETIRLSGENLLDLLNNILNLSKIDAGKMGLSLEDFELDEFLKSVVLLSNGLAQDKNIHLNLKIDSSLPQVIHSDRTKLKQILINLLNNAIKFSSEYSKVDLLVKKEASNLIFIVKDEGIGIPKERQEEVFKAFEQADGSTTRRFGGTGLGLTLVKEFVELMHGRIEMDSKLGLGTTFCVYIPLQAGHAQINNLLVNNHWENVYFTNQDHVLIVEDDETNRVMIAALLQELGLETTTAVDGREALIKAEEIHPNLILMDLHMPNMDGVEAIKLLRSMASTQNIPIAVFSANAFQEQKQQAMKLGINDYLVKPLNLKDLIPVLVKYLNPIMESKDAIARQASPDLNLEAQAPTEEEKPVMPTEVEQQLFAELQAMQNNLPELNEAVTQHLETALALADYYQCPYRNQVADMKKHLEAKNSLALQQLLVKALKHQFQ